MKISLKLEEAMMFALSLLLFHQLHYSWMWFWILFLSPDLGMLGYLVNTKVGAVSYNAFHHKGIAILIFIIGFYFKVMELEFVGILLFSHSSFDRMLGYGLKYNDSFQNTHLGLIGKNVADTKE